MVSQVMNTCALGQTRSQSFCSTDAGVPRLFKPHPDIFATTDPAPCPLGGFWHKASVLGYLPLALPIGLSPLLILTLCGSERVLVVSTEPLDDLLCLTTPGSAVPETGCCPCR